MQFMSKVSYSILRYYLYLKISITAHITLINHTTTSV